MSGFLLVLQLWMILQTASLSGTVVLQMPEQQLKFLG